MSSNNKPYKVKHDWKGEGEKAPTLSKNGKRIGRPPVKRYSANWGGKREGSGRKPKPSATISFRVPPEVREQMLALQERGFHPRDIFVDSIKTLCKTLGL